MLRKTTGRNVVEEALSRLDVLYSDPTSRVVVLLSGGKDATVALELAIRSAKRNGRLPVEALFSDDEVQLPGTTDYIRRVAQRTKEVRINWAYGFHPVESVVDRECPYWWTFDPLLKDRWVEKPPTASAGIKPDPREDRYFKSLVNLVDFPPPPIRSAEFTCDSCGYEFSCPPPKSLYQEKRFGSTKDNELKKCSRCKSLTVVDWDWFDPCGDLFSVVGTRSGESTNRRMAIASRGGWLAKKANEINVVEAWPIYDWKSDDVWKFIADNNLDYNTCYNSLLRAGVKKRDLRVTSMTISMSSIRQFKLAAKIWPSWADRVANRIDGMRTVLTTEKHHPLPRKGETWKNLYLRTCVRGGPDWIRDLSEKVIQHYRNQHEKHGGNWDDFPDEGKCCQRCLPNDSGSWKSFVVRGYAGFPLCISIPRYKIPHPNEFRPILEARHGKPKS